MTTGSDNANVDPALAVSSADEASSEGERGVRRRVSLIFRSGGARRARWGVFDQGISSLTNFAILALAAKVSSPASFGAFSVAITIYVVVLWVSRSLVAEPYVVRFSGQGGDGRRDNAHDAIGAAFAFGLVAAAGVVAVAFLTPSVQRNLLLTLAVLLPGLIAQDTYRYLLIAARQVEGAAISDLTWLATQTLLVIGLFGFHALTAVTLLLAFGFGATAGAVAGWVKSRVLPSVASPRRWFRKHRDLSVPFVIELLMVNGVGQLALLAVAGVAGSVAVGELRAATLLLSPPTVVFSGLFLVAVPEAVRLHERSEDSLVPFVLLLTAATCVTMALFGAALLLLPSHIGRALLGDNWQQARAVLVPVIVLNVANCAILSVVVGLRALAAARESLRVRIWAAPIVFLCAVIGGRVGSAHGAGVGLAIGSWLNAGLGWGALLRIRHRYPAAA